MRRSDKKKPTGALNEKLSMKEPGWLLELKALTEVPDLPLEIVNGLFDFVESPQKFIAVKADDSCATVAGECVVRLDPRDCLLSLLSALRTWNANFNVVKHVKSPVEG